jgi:hypothetical protein
MDSGRLHYLFSNITFTALISLTQSLHQRVLEALLLKPKQVVNINSLFRKLFYVSKELIFCDFISPQISEN